MFKLKDVFTKEDGKKVVQRFIKHEGNEEWFFYGWAYEKRTLEGLLFDGWRVEGEWVVSAEQFDKGWQDKYPITKVKKESKKGNKRLD